MSVPGSPPTREVGCDRANTGPYWAGRQFDARRWQLRRPACGIPLRDPAGQEEVTDEHGFTASRATRPRGHEATSTS